MLFTSLHFYKWKNINIKHSMKAGNSLDLAETAVVGQHSQVTV